MKSQVLHKVILIQAFLLAVLWFGMPAAIEAVSYDSSAADTNPLRAGNAVGSEEVDARSPLYSHKTYQVFLPLLVKQGCTHTIGLNVEIADARKDYSDVRPGDIVCIEAGRRGRLLLRNFEGAPNAPILFRNEGGQVIIDTDKSTAIAVRNSRYFRLSGSGSAGIQYGIKIVRSGEYGVHLNTKSSDYEVDHFDITGIKQQAIMAHTPATCSDGSTNNYDYDGDGKKKGDLDDVVNRGNFTQRNTFFHDNYIHDTIKEAFYLGSSHYGKDVQNDCASGEELQDNPVVRGMQVYNNRLVNIGQDAIQAGSMVEGCLIHHNTIDGYGMAKKESHRTGIINGNGSRCRIYSNRIEYGSGTGIRINAGSGVRVYNNIIIDAGQHGSMGASGIKVQDLLGEPTTSVYILNNTIVNPHNVAISYNNDSGTDNRIQNNMVVQSGNSYINTHNASNVVVSHNLHLKSIDDARFASFIDYTLRSGSPAIDSGRDLRSMNITTDYRGAARPQGSGFDIGATEQ